MGPESAEIAIITPESPLPPARTGACPYCLRNHLLRARGYAREVAEDPTRTWETERLLENLLLAEDHAIEMGDLGMKAQIREIRIPAEYGIPPTAAQLEPILARARAKILEVGGGAKSSPVVDKAVTPA